MYTNYNLICNFNVLHLDIYIMILYICIILMLILIILVNNRFCNLIETDNILFNRFHIKSSIDYKKLINNTLRCKFNIWWNLNKFYNYQNKKRKYFSLYLNNIYHYNLGINLARLRSKLENRFHVINIIDLMYNIIITWIT